MAVLRDRPYLASNFRVEVRGSGGITIAAGFCEVVFPDFVVRRTTRARSLPGQVGSNANLILRRGFQGALDLYNWFNAERRPAPRGKPRRRRDLYVTLLNEEHTEDVLAWRFTRVRPVRLSYSPLQAQVSELLIETIELEFELMEMQ